MTNKEWQLELQKAEDITHCQKCGELFTIDKFVIGSKHRTACYCFECFKKVTSFAVSRGYFLPFKRLTVES